MNHFRHEIESWMRLLEFVRAENNHIKTSIAEVASQDIGAAQLAEAEEFQNVCIRKDELMALARKDIYDFEFWLEHNPVDDPEIFRQAILRQGKLRTEMEILEQMFNQFKYKFHKFIVENF